MTESPGLGARLAWLLEHRRVGAEELADRAGANVDQVRTVLMGETPGDEMLRQLAAPLGLHAVDLFILADSAVPEDSAPLDSAAGQWVRHIGSHVRCDRVRPERADAPLGGGLRGSAGYRRPSNWPPSQA